MKQGRTNNIFIILVAACKPHPPASPTSGTDSESILRAGAYTDNVIAARNANMRVSGISNALLPPLSVKTANSKQVVERRFNVAAKDVPAGSFFISLVSGTKYNMLIDPNISGTISLELKNVTVEETLDAVREIYGYEYERTSTGYEIIPPVMKTQIFTVNYLNIKRTGKSRTELIPTQITNGTSSGGSTSGSQPNSASNTQTAIIGSAVETASEADFWKVLTVNLKSLVGMTEGRWVVVDPQASTVMIRAYPKELHVAADYLDHLQQNLQRQVIIEAKVLEVELDDGYQAGIDWNVLGINQNGIRNTAFTPPGGAFFSGTFKGGSPDTDFTSVIQLLETQGNVQTLSSPHVSTINNQEAVIKVGVDQFFVTGYTSNVTPSGSSNTTSQSVALTPFFSGITLDVTPQISASNEIVLYIHPSVSTVTEQNKTISLGSSDLTLPLALSTIRESDSVVRAKSGQIIVLGGLMTHNTSEGIAATPGLTKIPFVGAAARDTIQNSKKSELVILLKPIIAGDKTWGNQLQNSAGRLHRLKRGFHFGGMPEVFGDEAEANP